MLGRVSAMAWMLLLASKELPVCTGVLSSEFRTMTFLTVYKFVNCSIEQVSIQLFFPTDYHVRAATSIHRLICLCKVYDKYGSIGIQHLHVLNMLGFYLTFSSPMLPSRLFHAVHICVPFSLLSFSSVKFDIYFVVNCPKRYWFIICYIYSFLLHPAHLENV